MLISVSGIVGSGKTTIARQISTLLEAHGARPHYLRFRSLWCFNLLAPQARKRPPPPVDDVSGSARPPAMRWVGYHRRRLTATMAAGYMVRIAAFRLYRLSWRSGQWHVSNRYFYDLFAHYHLTTATERFWCSLLRKLIPAPDLAILVTASARTIAARRPNYSAEYVTEVGRGYDGLRAIFPELVELRTDPGDAPFDAVDALIQERLTSRVR